MGWTARGQDGLVHRVILHFHDWNVTELPCGKPKPYDYYKQEWSEPRVVTCMACLAWRP